MINLPKENQNCGNEWLKVDMSIVVRVGIENNVSKNLHPNNCIDEEKHPNQQDYIWKSLENDKICNENLLIFSDCVTYFEWLYKGPEQYSDGVSLPQQLDKSCCSKQPQKPNIDEVFL